MARRRVYRAQAPWVMGWAIFFLGVLGCLVDGLASARASAWAWDGGIAGALAFIALFALRIGVRVDGAGVRVTNLFSTKRLRWDEIERFELAPAGFYPYAGHVILKGGRDIPVAAITVARVFTESLKPSAQKPIDELNALLAAARDRGNVPVPPA